MERSLRLNFRAGIHFETGVPSANSLRILLSNAGEIPVGGRGSLGRTSPYFRFDFHANYPWKVTERRSSTLWRLLQRLQQHQVRLPGPEFS